MMDCKKALEEVGGDLAKAEELLRKQGLKAADLRSNRAAREGLIGHYIHLNSKIGVLAEVCCETDFAAGSDDFKRLVKDVCMQVAATRPLYVDPAGIPADVLEREKAILAAQVQGKPANIVDKIVEGKIKDYYKQVCLLDQPFIKDTTQTVGELVKGLNAKLGENIIIRRFVRFELGEEL